MSVKFAPTSFRHIWDQFQHNLHPIFRCLCIDNDAATSTSNRGVETTPTPLQHRRRRNIVGAETTPGSEHRIRATSIPPSTSFNRPSNDVSDATSEDSTAGARPGLRRSRHIVNVGVTNFAERLVDLRHRNASSIFDRNASSIANASSGNASSTTDDDRHPSSRAKDEAVLRRRVSEAAAERGVAAFTAATATATLAATATCGRHCECRYDRGCGCRWSRNGRRPSSRDCGRRSGRLYGSMAVSQPKLLRKVEPSEICITKWKSVMKNILLRATKEVQDKLQKSHFGVSKWKKKKTKKKKKSTWSSSSSSSSSIVIIIVVVIWTKPGVARCSSPFIKKIERRKKNEHSDKNSLNENKNATKRRTKNKKQNDNSIFKMKINGYHFASLIVYAFEKERKKKEKPKKKTTKRNNNKIKNDNINNDNVAAGKSSSIIKL
jgi:hypothetical protein